MKLYVEDAYVDGMYKLNCQYVGFSQSDFAVLMYTNKILSYEIPKTQSLKCCWLFRLNLINGERLTFSSKCTNVGGWNEIGSLNIAFDRPVEEYDRSIFNRESIEKHETKEVSLLTYSEENVYAETGVVLVNEVGGELIILCSPASGAVTVNIPGLKSELKPEFDFLEYKRKKL